MQESGDEILIYDLTSNQAHCLNQTTAIVWRNCDGKNSISDIVQKEKLPEAFVTIAVDELQKAGLMTEKSVVDIPQDRLSRRKCC